MDVVEFVSDCQGVVGVARSAGRSVGLVPTMGALHAGHRSLVARARAECDVVVVSIFVNPLQFGDPDDIEHYPRTLGTDLRACAESGVDVVFAPGVTEMYPSWPARTTTVSVGGVSEVLEGASRPGHFDGVGTVVAKLLAIAGPCRAYFGEKDFQQLAVVRQLVRDLNFPVEVVGCPTVRQADGLALSSRNERLSPVERAASTVLARALVAGRSALGAGALTGPELVDVMAEVIGTEPLVQLDYAAAVDHSTLREVDRLDGREVRLLVAARVGPVRLIDNYAARGDDGVDVAGATAVPAGSAVADRTVPSRADVAERALPLERTG